MGEIIPFPDDPARSLRAVATDKSCRRCGQPISPGTLYSGGPARPEHVACPTLNGTRATFRILRMTGSASR